MAEREKYIDEMPLEFEGNFNVKELFLLIKNFFLENGYEFRETKKKVIVTESGKRIEAEFEPWKGVDETAWAQIVLRIYMSDITDNEVERDGLVQVVNHGRIRMVFDAWIITEMESRWENRPFLYVMKYLIDKWIATGYMPKFDGIVVEDTTKLYGLIKAYLNLQHYK